LLMCSTSSSSVDPFFICTFRKNQKLWILKNKEPLWPDILYKIFIEIFLSMTTLKA
jgi:hypothetical protein